MRGAETMAWSRHQQVARGYLGNAPPPRIRFLRIVKKIRRSKHATNTHKHGRGSYLSDGTRGDSQSPVEAEPLRSKDRGLFTYNRNAILRATLITCELISGITVN